MYLEKANIIEYKSIKQNIKTIYPNANTKLK